MTRIFIAAVVGAIIYFVWAMSTWMIIPLHAPTIANFPNEAALTGLLKEQDLSSGVYSAPGMNDPEEMNDPNSEFVKNHESGPIYAIYYRKEGGAPMDRGVMVGGFLIDLFAAFIAAMLLSSVGGCCRSYWCRVGFVMGLGAFSTLMGDVNYWNWMSFPWDYTMGFVIESIIGWGLAGLAMAAIIKPAIATETVTLQSPAPATTTKAKTTAAPVALPKPIRNDAISLLATLQREARFVDIVKEPLGDYSDAQVGAAARDVLRDCGAVLDRLFKLEPVLDREEGAKVELPAGFDSSTYRITGNTSETSPSEGTLAHHGWKASRCEVPQWTGSKNAATVVSPAEVEVK